MGKNTYGTSVAVTIFGESHGAALVLCDLLALRFGTDWLRGE